MSSPKRFKGAKQKRASGRFYALPASVLQSKAFIGLSSNAVRLMLDFLEQYRGDDNGRLICTWAHMHEKRGWKSRDTLDKARAELAAAGFLFETVKGKRPNKASWYALTFFAIDPNDGYDVSPRAFPFMAFADPPTITLKNASLTTPGVSQAA